MLKPLILNKGDDADNSLLNYLKHFDNFNFLSEDSREFIEKLDLNNNLRSQQKILIELWPQVLTDALLNLKQNDSREFDPKNPKMKSFFDSDSLGTDELKSVLMGFSEFEGMMYGASPDRYRDHGN